MLPIRTLKFSYDYTIDWSSKSLADFCTFSYCKILSQCSQRCLESVAKFDGYFPHHSHLSPKVAQNLFLWHGNVSSTEIMPVCFGARESKNASLKLFFQLTYESSARYFSTTKNHHTCAKAFCTFAFERWLARLRNKITWLVRVLCWYSNTYKYLAVDIVQVIHLQPSINI